jgi:hypothetical protein
MNVESAARKINEMKENQRSYPCNRPWRPIELRDVEDPTDNQLTMALMSDFRAGRALRSRKIFSYTFLLEAG